MGAARPQRLIKTPKEAINVFDFEPVMRQNVPPAHFGYMASGIDDEVTLRRNREDFLKFQLRPRRLVDVSKVDMSVDILGTKYDSPIVLRAGRRPALVPRRRRARRRPRREGRQSSADPVHHDLRPASRRSSRRAARRSGCSSTPPTSGRSPRPSPSAPRPPAAPAIAVTVDRSGGRNQETLFRLRPGDTRDCNGCHDRTSLQTNLKSRAMFQGLDISGLRNTQSSAMTWDFFKRMRDTTKMKVLLKGILAWEDAVLAADAGVDGIIVSNHGARSEDSGRSTIDALPEIVEAVKGRIPILVDSRLPPRLRHRQGAVHGRDRGLRRPALHLGPRRVRPAGRRARAGAAAHRNLTP